ncbi:DUF5946 family protein [Ktedonobacter racemifer]|nr:DUF5946 family protein [Ktedonobacter racemifer]
MVMCPGCGLILPSTEEQLDERDHASSACRQVYDQLSAYTLSLQDVDFPHQFAVDTYAAQHAGTNLKPITLTFALVGLYLACEHNYTGRQVQRAHMLLAKTPKQWPSFRLPDTKATLSVLDVLNAPERETKNRHAPTMGDLQGCCKVGNNMAKGGIKQNLSSFRNG